MFSKNKSSKPLMQKQIPTVLGLLFLIGSLIVGLLYFSEGLGVFAPRATAESTPQKIRITNLKDNSLTITFHTEKKTPGYVKYGSDSKKLNSQASDDRDQLSGVVGEYNLHHITLRGLEPSTKYYFVIGTGSRTEFDNEGEPFLVTTSPRASGKIPEAITVFGSVSNQNGTPADGAIVYVSADNMGELSSLVRGSGSWAVPLSQALNKDMTDYANLSSNTVLQILAQGTNLNDQVNYKVLVEQAQPVKELTFGENPDSAEYMADGNEEKTKEAAAAPAKEEDGELQEDESSTATHSADVEDGSNEKETISGQLEALLGEAEPIPTTSTASTQLSIDDTSDGTITTPNPIVFGNAAPHAEVTVLIQSENHIQQTVVADDNGDFELDLATLGANLEPGEHTATYSYTDPATGEEVTKTKTFWVEDSSRLLAQANTTQPQPTPTTANVPYGTGDPYPMTTPTPSPVPSLMPTPKTTVATQSTATNSTSTARTQPVGTDGALTKAGSMGATAMTILGGMFFILIGTWSWWLAGELEQE